jgi:hypothetical protein
MLADMAGLNPKQMMVIRTLIDSAPDGVIGKLDTALGGEHLDGAMAEIRDMVGAECGQRRTRGLVFRPLIALCPKVAPSTPHTTFPARTPAMLWAALKAGDPDQTALACAAAMHWTDDSDPPEVFDRLCAMAAEGLRDPAGTPFATVAIMLDEAEVNGAEHFASYLDLVPLARGTIGKLPEWLARMTEDRAVTIRLAFKDATTIAPDAGPKFFEILCAQLAEPWQILRIISAVMDRPGDSYMAASELGHIGERLLGEVERRMEAFAGFDPHAGAKAGEQAAEAIAGAVCLIAEFEHSVALAKDGPWGGTILNYKRNLAQQVEKVLAKADDAAAAALPLRPARFGKGRGSPRFDNPSDARAVARAEAMMAFVNHARNAAPAGGYASFRAKVIERLDDRLDHYVEDVLDHLRGEEGGDLDRAAEFLEIAARLIGLLRDEKAAQIVRRRAAA